MRIDIVTIFPGMFDSVFGETIIKRAREKGLVEFHMHDIRNHAKGKHRCVDDAPYGGGAGMVMMPEPIVDAVFSVPRVGKSLRVLLTPQGERLTQKIVRELKEYDQLILISCRYEGLDERAREMIAEREISIGDYVLSGGEVAAMVVVDSVTRLLPGALSNEKSAENESFELGLLEYPQYTRPEVFRDRKVPEVLLSGNHAEIEKWRKEESLKRTKERRPELLSRRPELLDKTKGRG